jgi:putative PIN family toxin of toxin-antitoxin system
MQVVADTNTVVSGLLWHGAPRQVLDAARAGIIELFTSAVLLVELEDVLHRKKFAQRLALAGLTPRELVEGYAALATLIEPTTMSSVVVADPDDDAVLACAVAARAEVIVSGDSHLRNLKNYQGISILTAAELVIQISTSLPN